MMQTDNKIPQATARWVLITAMVVVAVPTGATDRTTLLVPIPHDAITDQLPLGVYADEAFGAPASDGWKAYMRLWKAHHQDPSDTSIRRFLGLPLKASFEANARRGRSSIRWLGWRAGSYAQVDTPHFTIYSRADAESSKRVAEDLERCYWIWTQMFFPLWEASAQVSSALGELPAEQSVQEYLAIHAERITVRRKLRVVLFQDASEYQRSLGREVPGVERSTGFYNDEKQTTFLYASERDDAATRRHEMVHQLFREATRSRLARDMPGEESGFWIIEGIAGYFESLYLSDDFATVGGWDSSRLQFARYRMLVGGDEMSMGELTAEGRLAVQQRQDIARWYAHAIAETHHLLDGGDTLHRQWVYQQLAERYKVRADLPDEIAGIDLQAVDRSVRGFLSIDDDHIASNPAARPLRQLCLAGCEITQRGLDQIAPSPALSWLDLSRLPIGSNAVRRMAPQPSSMEQLTLEATRIDADLVDWLRAAKNLRELDLSWTQTGDSVIEAISTAADLSTLWMTGTQVSDRSIDRIAKMMKLGSVDLQRTEVTDAGIARLRAVRPKLNINPLELRSP